MLKFSEKVYDKYLRVCYTVPMSMRKCGVGGGGGHGGGGEGICGCICDGAGGGAVTADVASIASW
jgi:hypothetical protein